MYRPLLPLLLAFGLTAAQAQAPKQEFRGAWVASVANLDWPSRPGLPTDQQQTQLVRLLDGLKAAGINAVFFQVRPEADAFYDSPFEPWSYWLTGEQGAAPDPYYDPLAFAVEEAHQRGMELHAWLNPYRADRGSNYPKAPGHVTNEHPDWVLTSGTVRVLDPGLPVVRDRIAAVVADIGRRYEVDGIHFDDYFYPYPPNQIRDQDADTFAEHPRGFTDLGDWRRDNVNLMVAQVQDSIEAVRPEAVFGISPFGIYRPGVPTGVTGLDAYNVIYADPLAWLAAETVDYLVPQLYWSSERVVNGSFNQQRHTTLAAWWGSVRDGRHIYTGIAAYRAGQAGYDAEELPTQVRIARASDELQGSVFFRTYAGLLTGGLGLKDSLQTDLYRTPALTPTMPWRSLVAPEAPSDLRQAVPAEGVVPLIWDAPDESAVEPRFFAVYRVPQAEASDLATALQKAENLAGVTGETRFFDQPAVGLYTYVVTSVSPNSIESAPSNAVEIEVGTPTEPGAPLAFALDAWPNPVASEATVSFTLRQPAAVTVRVVDALGREVARLLDREARPAATHTLTWAPGGLGSGAYFVVLEADGERAARALTVVR